MSPPKKIPVLPAATDPGLHGRVDKLETRMDTAESRLDGFERTVTLNTAAVQAGAQISAENNLLLNKVLLFVSGQSDPGLKVPGLADRFDALQQEFAADKQARAQEIAALRADNDALKTAEATRKGWLAGAMLIFTLVSGALGWYFYDKFHALLLLLDHVPKP